MKKKYFYKMAKNLLGMTGVQLYSEHNINKDLKSTKQLKFKETIGLNDTKRYLHLTSVEAIEISYKTKKVTRHI